MIINKVRVYHWYSVLFYIYSNTPSSKNTDTFPSQDLYYRTELTNNLYSHKVHSKETYFKLILFHIIFVLPLYGWEVWEGIWNQTHLVVRNFCLERLHYITISPHITWILFFLSYNSLINKDVHKFYKI